MGNMVFNISKVRGFNVLLYALMAFQLVALIGIATILVSAVSNIGLTTTVSTTIMFLLGLPMLVLLYLSSTDKTLKSVFLGLLANIAFLSAAGIIWYIMSYALGSGWLVQIAKGIMVVGYVPLIYALYVVNRAEYKKLDRKVKFFIGFVNVSCSLVIVFFALTHLSGGDSFDIIIYTLSTLGDIVILALAASLIVVNFPTKLRYIFSIVFCFILLSFAGDALNLIDAMKVGTYGLAAYSSYFYDAMLLFMVTALFIFLIYLFFKDSGTIAIEEANKRLSDTRHAMDDLIMQMPDAACVFSTDGYAVMVNDPFLRVFGVERKDAIGKFNLFNHAALLQCEMSQKLPFIKKGETIAIDRAEVRFPGGRRAYLSMRVFPTFCQDGTISSYISICEDVTARVKADEELKHAKELGELYIDLMGHDINNMNQVGMGYLEIALNTLEADGDKKKLLLKPLEAMANSSRLIDNVKKLRRANEGDMYLRPINLSRLLKGVIAEHGQAPGREVDIRYEAADNAIVMANELLKDVFVNLVSNAIKHSSGPVHIIIDHEAIEADGKRYYRITVEDDGPGIPEELKPIIFGRILRGHARIGGNGIGLYLVKALIDNFGGSIAVEDRMPGELKKGTRFIVTLPAA